MCKYSSKVLYKNLSINEKSEEFLFREALSRYLTPEGRGKDVLEKEKGIGLQRVKAPNILLKWLKVLAAQSCLTLCDPMDCSSSDSSVHGILQARILEWATIPFSRGFWQTKDWIWAFHTAGRFFIIWTTREPNRSSLATCSIGNATQYCHDLCGKRIF